MKKGMEASFKRVSLLQPNLTDFFDNWFSKEKIDLSVLEKAFNVVSPGKELKWKLILVLRQN